MDTKILQQLLDDQVAKRPVVHVTELTSGDQQLIYPTESADDSWLFAEAQKALTADKSRIVESGESRYFLRVFNPPLKMIIVGAVHIAQPLSRMAGLAGYDVTVIDPRAAFASDERFPNQHLICAWPDVAMEQVEIDARTAIVTLTHDPKLDDPALLAALKSDAFYIGALGSRRTHGARVERMQEAGISDDLIARIHGPVGLDIGAESTSEIAISIMGEVTALLRK